MVLFALREYAERRLLGQGGQPGVLGLGRRQCRLLDDAGWRGLFNFRDVAGLQSQNLGRILSQPQIVVLSGKEGRIQVGQDFSIKTRDFAGNVIDNFFSTGTILSVTPTIHAEGDMTFVHLTIHAERSNAIPDPVSTRINKSQADTQVLLLDGESTMVGGLYSRDYKTVRKGVPFLKDLPWWVLGLRYAFGYNLKDGLDKELIVVIRATVLQDLKTRTTLPKKALEESFKQSGDNARQNFKKSWDAKPDNQENK